MGRLLQNRTPAQLAWILAASNLLVSSCFATFFIDSYRHPNSHRVPLWAVGISFSLLILGVFMGIFAETALKDGITSEQWPEAVVASTRRFFTQPGLSGAIFALMAASVAVLVISVVSSKRLYTGAWIFLFPAMSLTRFKTIFSRSRKSDNGPGTQDPPKPLQSEHWGIPPQSPSH
jgi:hypothetical protein